MLCLMGDNSLEPVTGTLSTPRHPFEPTSFRRTQQVCEYSNGRTVANRNFCLAGTSRTRGSLPRLSRAASWPRTLTLHQTASGCFRMRSTSSRAKSLCNNSIKVGDDRGNTAVSMGSATSTDATPCMMLANCLGKSSSLNRLGEKRRTLAILTPHIVLGGVVLVLEIGLMMLHVQG